MKIKFRITLVLLLFASIGFSQNNDTVQERLILKNEVHTTSPAAVSVQPYTKVETPNGIQFIKNEPKMIILETSQTVLNDQIRAIEFELGHTENKQAVQQLNAKLTALSARLQYVIDNNLN